MLCPRSPNLNPPNRRPDYSNKNRLAAPNVILPSMHRIAASTLLILTLAFAQKPSSGMREWLSYGGDQGGSKYSPLENITRLNIGRLQLAWRWKTNEQRLEQYKTFPGIFEVTPLMAAGTLYLSTPYNRVVALDSQTGVERWSYDPKAYVDGQVPNGTGFVHRGVALWRDSSTGK